MPAAFRWHGRAALQVPANVTLPPLPPHSPELNPVERVWLYLRERHLSFRLHRSEQAIVDALCAAWNVLRDETGRLATLTGYIPGSPRPSIRSANRATGMIPIDPSSDFDVISGAG